MLFRSGRCVGPGRIASTRRFARPKVQSADVTNRKRDNCDDGPRYDVHWTPPSAMVALPRVISSPVLSISQPLFIDQAAKTSRRGGPDCGAVHRVASLSECAG